MNSRKNKKKYYLLQDGITNYSKQEISIFKTDDTGLFSLTSAKIAKKLSENIINLFPDNYNIIITDSTASVGGNTIPFLLNNNFIHVNAVELDKTRYEMLHTNIDIKKKSIKGKYNLYNCSYLDIKDQLVEDVIFIDPPWGGPEYYKETQIKLFLDNIHLSNIVNKVFITKQQLQYVVIKVPKNFNIIDFKTILSNKLSIEKFIFSNKLKKINFFFIKRI